MKYRVGDYLGQEELLAMLAEECSELAQAALKLRRVMDGTNPTPASWPEAVKNLNEEAADVLLCLGQIEALDYDRMEKTRKKKLARWLLRLMDSGKNRPTGRRTGDERRDE